MRLWILLLLTLTQVAGTAGTGCNDSSKTERARPALTVTPSLPLNAPPSALVSAHPPSTSIPPATGGPPDAHLLIESIWVSHPNNKPDDRRGEDVLVVVEERSDAGKPTTRRIHAMCPPQPKQMYQNCSLYPSCKVEGLDVRCGNDVFHLEPSSGVLEITTPKGTRRLLDTPRTVTEPQVRKRNAGAADV